MKKSVFLLALCCLLVGCKDMFQYHPYDVRLDGESRINQTNIGKIEALCKGKDTLRVAFIGDTHGWYGETKGMVADINAKGNIDFVVHMGDLTDCGTTREYEWARDILAGLQPPYVALIGNHDFLGTGDDAYGWMYGDTDFSFIAGRVKFVCLNTNATEYDYLAAVPNLDYMEEQIHADSALFDRSIICMHARPYSEQFNNNVAKVFGIYVRNFPGIMFSINGHDHRLQATELYGDGIMYYGVNSGQSRSYLLFTITPAGYEYEVVYY